MPPNTSDPVDEIVTKADISTVIIKHGALDKEVIMKYVIKKLIKQIQIYWNRVYEKQIDANILALMTEKFVSSNSFPEFRQIHKHFDGNLPATMGHSNRQRPDGVIEFKFNNDICHLFIEIDANNKNLTKQREALKIWQDISCSVEGQTSSTSSGESLSACILRINTHCINCSGVKHKTMPSRKSTVASTSGDTDHVIGDEDKKLKHAYDTKHIDEVKQVFVTMHNAFARQITRVIWAWLACVFKPSKTPPTSAITDWIKASTQNSTRQDFCFWIGEYQIDSSLTTKIQTIDLDGDYETRQHRNKEDASAPIKIDLKEQWADIADETKFKGVEQGHMVNAFKNLELFNSDDFQFEIDLDSQQANYIYKPFYSVNCSWTQESSLTKITSNVPRSQGHWVRQMETFKDFWNSDENAIPNWIKHDQLAFMQFETDVQKTRGNFEEKTTVTFSNTHKEKCQFDIDIGLFGVKIPRVSTVDLQKSLHEYYNNAHEDLYDCYPDFDPNQDPSPTRKSLYKICKSFERDTLTKFRANIIKPPTNPISQQELNNYDKWVQGQINYFETAKKARYEKTFKKLTGMWYSRHISMILSTILNSKKRRERERKAHILFRNTRQDNFDIPQPNALPLAKLCTQRKALKWDLVELKQNNAAHLIPVLWDPLSGMLINAIYFFIRGIKQNSSLGRKNFEMDKNQIRSTEYVYRSIKSLMQADAILPDLLASHDPDRISANSQNLNTLMLKSIADKELKQEFSPSLKDYLQKIKSEHCVAFCKLIRCTDDSMLHWTAKMYQSEEFKEEISRNIRLFPLAGQAMILRMLAEAAEDNPIVWKSNIEVQDIKHRVGNDEDFDDDLSKILDQDDIDFDYPMDQIMTTYQKSHKLYLVTRSKSKQYRIEINENDISNNITFDDTTPEKVEFFIRHESNIEKNRSRWKVISKEAPRQEKTPYDRKCIMFSQGYNNYYGAENQKIILQGGKSNDPSTWKEYKFKWIYIPKRVDIDSDRGDYDESDENRSIAGSDLDDEDGEEKDEDDEDEEEHGDSMESDED